MDIGVLTVPLGEESPADAFAYLSELGVDAVELGVGGWPGTDDVAAGSTVTVGATADCVIHLVWEAEETSSVLTTFDGPER